MTDTDAELLHAAARGDGKACHQLVDLHSGRLYRVAFSLVGNVADAEDVLQESWAGAFRSAKKFEGRSSVRSWLTRIVMTQAARFWRSRKGKREASLESAGEPQTTTNGPGLVDAKIDLTAALQLLSQEHREVIVLREIDGLAYEEIADVLGVPRGTVESRLYRARAELKRYLVAWASRP